MRSLISRPWWIPVAALVVGAGLGWLFVNGEPAPTIPAKLASADREVELSLDEADRRYLWDVEHHGNVLNQTRQGRPQRGQQAEVRGTGRTGTLLVCQFSDLVVERGSQSPFC